VAYRVHFKLLLLAYKALNNQGPQYIKDFLKAHSITDHRLRSRDHGLLLRSQELSTRSLVIASLSTLGHFSEPNFHLKYDPVQVSLFLNQS